MATILLLMYHGQGHFNAVLKPAKLLAAAHRVVFAGHQYFQPSMKIHGFEYVGLKTVPFALGFEKWVNQQEGKKPLYWNCLRDRWNQRLYRARSVELSRVMDQVQPDIILIDAWQSTDFVVLYPELRKRGIRMAFIHTMLPLAMKENVPPLNSPALPGDTNAIRRHQAEFARQQTRSRTMEWLTYFGKTKQAMLDEIFRRNNIPAIYRSRRHSLFAPSFDNVHELVFAPQEFDFDQRPGILTHYLGFMADVDRHEASDGQFENAFQHIETRVKDGIPLVYCSFGSVVYEDETAIRGFIEKLISLNDDAKWLLVVSCSDAIASRLRSHGDRVFFFTRVPQLRVLSRSSVFITHGGLNSIKEAIYQGVPMLVYPASRDVDHEGNAARVFYHELGLRGQMSEPGDVIGKKIHALMTDPRFRQNLQALKKKDMTDTPARLLEFLSGLEQLA
ncbi:MAG TPA: glycosyltransferase [Chryseosolibacter sp.]|nr:glycosyltransferase [Chryseosolibacter sp.]